MIKGPNQKQLYELILDDREIAGLRGRDKIALVIKIQAIFRGSIARKRVK